MEELIREVTREVGITEEEARRTVEAIVGYLFDRLPGPCIKAIETRFGTWGKIESPFTLLNVKELAALVGITLKQAEIAIKVVSELLMNAVSDDCAKLIDGYARPGG